MKAEQLRTLADGLNQAAAANIKAGMAPLAAMNPSAPFARGPRPQCGPVCDRPECHAGQPRHIIGGWDAHTLRPIVSSAQPVPLPPAPKPVDYRANKFGTFFYEGLAEEEIRKEQEGR